MQNYNIKTGQNSPVTVGHIRRELSRYVYYFLHEGGAVSGTVADTQYKPSPIPDGGEKVPLCVTFTHPKEWMIDQPKDFVYKQSVSLNSRGSRVAEVAEHSCHLYTSTELYSPGMLRT